MGYGLALSSEGRLFRALPMAHAFSLSLAAGITIAGVAAGLQLGHSAIAEINPVHFESRQTSTFYSDLVPNRPQEPTPQQLADALVNELNISGRPNCIGCSEGMAALNPAATHAYDSSITDAEPVSDLAYPEQRVSESAADREWEGISRYASYPVSQAEAAASPEPKPESVEVASSSEATAILAPEAFESTQH